MKKTLLSLCLMAASFTTFAQVYNGDPTVTFGIKGGANLASLSASSSESSESISNSMLTTFNAGIFVDFKIDESVSVQPSLLYMGKGGKSTLKGSFETGMGTADVTADAKVNLYYLHLPVNIFYHAPVGDDKLFFGAGPFLSYGLSGKRKGSATATFNGESQTETVDEDVVFGDGEDQVKRMDYGVTATVGFKFGTNFLISANYDLGLATANTSFDTGTTTKVKTRVLGFSVGYSF